MKKKLIQLVFTVLLGIILSAGCAPTTPEPTAPAPAATSTATRTPTLVPTFALPTLKIETGDGINHELAFVIRNPGRYSGEGGQPAWLGWGANHFSIAPDGSFWIADTPADPDRLLHYSPTGDLLQIVPMRFAETQYWARDIAADASGIWVLDYISKPGQVLHINASGELLAIFAIPPEFASFRQEETIMPGLWHIPFSNGEKVLLDGPLGIVELTVSEGGAVFQKVAGYPLRGRIFSVTADGLRVDDRLIKMEDIQPEHFLNRVEFLGAAADGSFLVREVENNLDQGKLEPASEFVRYYNAAGELRGIALLPPQAEVEPGESVDVALGPDGNPYALYARADHSVEIYRLRFAMNVVPLIPPLTTIPQPAFTPLLPSGKVPATDLEAAREAMLSFFAALAQQRFDEAASLFGGSYEEYRAQDVYIAPEQYGRTWQEICAIEFCLAVTDILDSRQVAADTYEFLVGFSTENGGRFAYSICCGNFQPPPKVDWFVYSVKVQKQNEQWLVMGGPLPLP